MKQCYDDTMSKTKKQPKSDKKIVSLSVSETLMGKLDEYAADNGVSRSAAVEDAIVCLTKPIAGTVSGQALPVNNLDQLSENSLVQSGSVFASPQIGQAIMY
jgi:hypothetical protein